LKKILDSICNTLCRKKNEGTSLKKSKDSGIKRAFKYLKDRFNLIFPPSLMNNWNDLNKYRKLRNIVVHNDKQIPNDKNEKVTDSPYYQVLKSIVGCTVSVNKEGTIGMVESVSIDCVKSFIKTSELFLNGVCELLKEK
jgi:hypothetical protein